jgi:exopolysaccharide biosynthesis polyprenyl glycosylphosphotransferase
MQRGPRKQVGRPGLSIHETLVNDTAHTASREGVLAGSTQAFRLLKLPVERLPLQIDVAGQTPSRLRAFAKRAIDLVVAVSSLLLLAPLMVAAAAIIRLESPGPCLFRQQRLGLNGKPFRILKFRTMYVLEDGDDVRQAEPNDARVTPVGRLLRASSFDELPQFINVLKGEMSLVGPRPHAVAHDRLFGSLIANYALRRRVKPGITGWAQVNGLRGATPTVEVMRRRVEFDVWYARNASLLLDIKILLRTPLELLRRRNAY